MHVNDIVAERAQETVDQITGAGGTAAVASFDVTDYDAIDRRDGRRSAPSTSS